MNKEIIWFSRIYSGILILLFCFTVEMPAIAILMVFVALCVLNITLFIKEL